ncbi:MAG: microviridin/marinostatin family tricyclic proteinase inhibitor [Moorea sp. SIOASIH]|uniref:microviridin/marinostatin family tricyclic proteinase inhibitor n=1 Tax=Moorena sp. SIOASIH TaxID=2607817 RepID=UPI0013BB2DF5|nr:microviridin/marinostatin family tricyclic proteinase inhibitor [Moorena sp. SIOASIH]NEO41737.1 microviridin/marinostatin family tricyclic proteinase inhibitor [Moorena sp. SIOASIH]
MSNMDKPEENSQAVPFFARYLEGQWCEELSEEEMDDVRGGRGFPVTEKYPSDHEEGGGCFTDKYPSDQEDGGGGPIFTKKYPSDHEEAMTRKYPSDHEDGGGGPIVMTLKFPSDEEDTPQK